nr:restriction endonuclease subunit S [Candidatus Omnitrophota bacterium]
MKRGWEVKKISEIGNIYNGNSINEEVKKDKYTGIKDGLPYIATKDVSYESIINYENGVKIPFEEISLFKIAPKNTVLICAEGGSAGRKIGFTNQDICFGNKLFATTTNKNAESRFVYYYYFSSIFQKYFSTELAGLIGGVSMNKFKDIEIPLPSLTEQQRIVAVLDKVFVTLAKAKESVEKNLQNNRELFNSYLQSVFVDSGIGWEKKKLGEVVKLEYGKPLPDDKRIPNGKYPVYGANGEKDRTDEFYYDKPSIIVGRKGSAGEVNLTEKRFWPLDVTYFVTFDDKKYTLEFLHNLLLTLNLRKLAKGVKPGINRNEVYEIRVNIPPIPEQKRIVVKFVALSGETKKLEAIYQKKLIDLEELKKSILQKAFAGELTGACS